MTAASRVPIWRPIRPPPGAAFQPLALEPLGTAGLQRVLQPATTVARGRALAAARYIVIDARPFMKGDAAAGAPSLQFLFHTPDTGRTLYALCAYDLRTDAIYYVPPCSIHIDLRRQTAYIATISAVPGLATGTTWVEVAKAIADHLGIRRVDLYDASTRMCNPGDFHVSHSYSHYLALRRGTSYYEDRGFRHINDAEWRRLVASVARLSVDRVQAEFRALAAALPVKDKDTLRPRLEEALRIWDRIACPAPTHAACVSTVLSCQGFAEYESLLEDIHPLLESRPPRTFPALRRLCRILDKSSGMRRMHMVGGKGVETKTVNGLTYTLDDEDEHNSTMSVTTRTGRHITDFTFNRRHRRLYVYAVPENARRRRAVFAHVARTFGVDRIHLYTPTAPFIDYAALGAQIDPIRDNTDYDTPEDTRAAVEAALKVAYATHIPDLLADLNRLHREASTLMHVTYRARGEIRYYRPSPMTAGALHLRAKVLEDAATWGDRFPVAYKRGRMSLMNAFLVSMPTMGWIKGRRRYVNESFWKAVNVLKATVSRVCWTVTQEKEKNAV